MPKKKLPTGMVKRGMVYWADFRIKGRRIRKGLCGNLRTATELLNELRARAQRADSGLPDNDLSVEELMAQYMRHCRQTLKPSTVQRYEFNLAAILPEMPRRVKNIIGEAVFAYRESRLADGIAPRTINMDVGALSTMLTWGVTHKLLASNPIQAVRPLPDDHPKEGRALTENEVGRLLAASPQPWRDIWYALLVTGLRKGELAALTFSDVDWDSRELTVRGGVAKNHNARRIPIDPDLWDILCRQEDGRTDRQPDPRTPAVEKRFTRNHVFVTTANTALTHGSVVYHAFVRHCKAAGIVTRTVDADGHEIDHVDVHSTRRTFATNLITNGADPKSVQELMGHKTLAMTMNLYTKINAGTKRQALGRLSYGSATPVPDDVLELVEPKRFGHTSPTTPQKSEMGKTQKSL